MALVALAAERASLEQPESAGGPDRERIERIYLSLCHRHVPTLEDSGLWSSPWPIAPSQSVTGSRPPCE